MQEWQEESFSEGVFFRKHYSQISNGFWNGKGNKVIKVTKDYFILQESVVCYCVNMDLEEHLIMLL